MICISDIHTCIWINVCMVVDVYIFLYIVFFIEYQRRVKPVVQSAPVQERRSDRLSLRTLLICSIRRKITGYLETSRSSAFCQVDLLASYPVILIMRRHGQLGLLFYGMQPSSHNWLKPLRNICVRERSSSRGRHRTVRRRWNRNCG